MKFKPIFPMGVLLFAAFVCLIAVSPAKAHASVSVNVVADYGADNTGASLTTSQIQAAVDYVNANGGGMVNFPAGTYKTTTINLKSNVTLNLESGSVIEASPTQSDWTAQGPVISAISVSNVGIEGSGEINGSGGSYWDSGSNGYLKGNKPWHILVFQQSSNISVSGITLRESASWTQHYYNCDNVTVDGITVRNPTKAERKWLDGIDINGSRHVVVENSDIETGDDGIVLKNIDESNKSNPRPDMYDVTIKNDVVASTTNATKIGTETVGNIYNVTFDHITVNEHSASDAVPAISAISVESNDHDAVHDITFSNYVVNNTDTPIFMEVENRTSNLPGSMRQVYNITVSNFKCLYSTSASQINVEQGGKLSNITFNGLEIHNYGTSQSTAMPPYLTGGYPDAYHYDPMPAYGLFARDVDGLHFAGPISFFDHGHTGRQMVTLQNVTNFDDSGIYDSTGTALEENVLGDYTYADKSNNWSSNYYELHDGSTASEAKATDGNETWIEYDFPTTRTLNKARIYDDHSGSYYVGQWKVQYYNGSGWVDAFPYTTSTAGWNEQDFPDIQTSKVRFYAKPDAGKEVGCFEYELYADANYGQSQVINSGTYAAKSGNWSSDYAYVFDGTTSNEAKTTDGNEAWMEFDFTQPATIRSAKIYDDHAGSYYVGQWKVQYYNGTDWVDAFPYTNSAAGWNEKSFPEVSASKIRLYVKPDAGKKVGIFAFQCFSVPVWKVNVNLADGSTYSQDSGWTNASFSWDGDTSTGATASTQEAWIEYDFGTDRQINKARVYDDNSGNQITDWKVQYWDGSAWQDAFPYTASDTAGWQEQSFSVNTSKVRFYGKNTNSGYNAGIQEFECWGQ